jgi:transposase
MSELSARDVSAAVRFASFVGVDLHKYTVTLVAVDPGGRELCRLTCHTKCVERIETFLSTLPRPCHLAVEAVGFVEWFIDRFRPCVGRMDIADATELSNRRGKRRKNDDNDAFDIARRLARGECPLGWIAPDEVMQLRKLGRHWRHLSRTLARAKHAMKSMLNAANLIGPKFDGASAHKWLLASGHLLKDVQRLAFGDFVDVVQLLERQRDVLRRKIITANRSPSFEPLTAILKSVPGIDEI